jgi:hypothetical protein
VVINKRKIKLLPEARKDWKRSMDTLQKKYDGYDATIESLIKMVEKDEALIAKRTEEITPHNGGEGGKEGRRAGRRRE